MKSFQHELVPPQLRDLDLLAELYQDALKALAQDEVDEVMVLLDQANPILAGMQLRDRKMRDEGVKACPELGDRIREVLALHRQLLTTCGEEQRITKEACGRVATSRKFLKGYRPRAENLGQLLDGEG